MNNRIDRVPAIPLIANDPYFSIWMPADTLNQTDSVHWTGARKPLKGMLTVDGKKLCFLGKDSKKEMKTVSLSITPTRTVSVLEEENVRLTLSFWSPALPEDLDSLSTPITFVDYALEALDGRAHQVDFEFSASSMLCYDGPTYKPLTGDAYCKENLHVAFVGQANQRVLGHSGDHVTMDWGYLYMASASPVQYSENGLVYQKSFTLQGTEKDTLLLGYDDIASIFYFGTCCRAWFARGGKTFPEALAEFAKRHDELLSACERLDEQVLSLAERIGGEDYKAIAAIAWRHTFAAHKLIATPSGEMAFLSKENDSNGCIGTVDVSYPSIPLFLRFCPELVNALCRPVLEFASMPVWEHDFAPHDVGRYPYATGQMYGAKAEPKTGNTPLPYYLYPAGSGIYEERNQMPVEECGNLLIMLESAMHFGAKDDLLKKYAPVLQKWVRYLDEFGEDPGEQLCTDDFAGHLAHNINLSAKAVVGVACFGRMMAHLGKPEEAEKWDRRARVMAQSWLARSAAREGTALTFDGKGWSMKYNLVWDKVLGLHLLPEDFYRRETESYLPRINEYGLPLDSRADYTKSDWTLWVATMACEHETFCKLLAPVARTLRCTTSRVAFSDWYDTKTGRYVHFIARSVQGGVYMPMLAEYY